MKIKLYKTVSCPKCKILCMKMDKKGLEYEVCTDIDEMTKLGIKSVPVLFVDDVQYDFVQANKWVNEVETDEH